MNFTRPHCEEISVLPAILTVNVETDAPLSDLAACIQRKGDVKDKPRALKLLSFMSCALEIPLDAAAFCGGRPGQYEVTIFDCGVACDTIDVELVSKWKTTSTSVYQATLEEQD